MHAGGFSMLKQIEQEATQILSDYDSYKIDMERCHLEEEAEEEEKEEEKKGRDDEENEVPDVEEEDYEETQLLEDYDDTGGLPAAGILTGERNSAASRFAKKT
jgi:hypothetical protein